ncbi:hypothetical protein BJY04DRAFT_196970 [Aspergillus karnatakaensis]|uniref:SDR family oxidoreductase n=1 Tax=Aspergillus karnatakaensis TaxID=1810916 RepID=UPI003CCDAF6F
MAAKTIIVTGASRGIGLAVTRYLLTHPQKHNVVVIARSIEPLQALKNEFTNQVAILNGDLSDPSLAQKAVDLAHQHFNALDGLVLNHGILGQVGKIATADISEWKKGYDVNFFSLVAFVTAALPSLRERRGKIILTSSGASVSAYRGWGLYGSTKAAMNHLALSLGEEEEDVVSVSVRPGMVDTEMQRELREDHATTLEPQVHAKFTGVHKDGKLLRPEQPGHVMAKLVLDAPKELSGKFLSWNDQQLEAFQA